MSLHLQNINIQIGGVDHLKGFTHEFKRGRLYTILGRTLAGKTTLLRTIAGLLEPQSGSVQFCGKDLKDVPVWQRKVAMVYQQFINYPHLNVIANVVFPLLRNGVPAKDAKQRAADVLAMVGLYEYRDRRPSELSGGQQQRVALARALAKQSEIILLDEPLANLDYKLREQLREEFHNIFEKQSDAIVIYTTTEPAEAIQLGHELIVMDKGAIAQRGKPLSVYHSPASTVCAEIINDPPMNLYKGSIQFGQIVLNGQIRLSLPEHLKRLAEGSYCFGLRAADIYIDGDINHTIKLCEIAGSQTILHLKGEIGDSVLYIDGVHNYSVGETVKVSLATELLYVFDQNGRLVCSPEIMEK